MRQSDSALRTARARGGRGVCVLLMTDLGWGSVGGLGLALAGPALLLRMCVCGGGRVGAWEGVAGGVGGTVGGAVKDLRPSGLSVGVRMGRPSCHKAKMSEQVHQ